MTSSPPDELVYTVTELTRRVKRLLESQWAALWVEGDIEASEGLEISTSERLVSDLCPGLWPIFPAQERVVGSFSLVASAARQIDIDVQRISLHHVPDRRLNPGQGSESPACSHPRSSPHIAPPSS